MKHINIFSVILFLVFTYCNKEENAKLNNQSEYYIIAGIQDITVNYYFDYDPDYYLPGQFSLGQTLIFSDSFDVNLDGTLDLAFTKLYHDYLVDIEGAGILTEVQSVESRVKIVYQDSLRIAGPFYLGDTINKNYYWRSSLYIDDSFSMYTHNNIEFYYFSFIGLQIFNASDTLYGWLRIEPPLHVFDASINKLR